MKVVRKMAGWKWLKEIGMGDGSYNRNIFVGLLCWNDDGGKSSL